MSGFRADLSLRTFRYIIPLFSSALSTIFSREESGTATAHRGDFYEVANTMHGARDTSGRIGRAEAGTVATVMSSCYTSRTKWTPLVIHPFGRRSFSGDEIQRFRGLPEASRQHFISRARKISRSSNNRGGGGFRLWNCAPFDEAMN